MNRKTALKLYIGFCDHFNFNYRAPAICLFIEYMAHHFSSPASINNYVTNVKSCLIRLDADVTPFSHIRVKDALAAVAANLRHKPHQAPPISTDHLLYD